MAPFIIAVIVAAGLFGSGTAVKPQAPELGTALQVAGVGTLAGGAVGAVAAGGAGAALASGLGTTTYASTVTATALIGGGAGLVLGDAASHLSKRNTNVAVYDLTSHKWH